MVRYFGYGSLVNAATHAAPQELMPATLHGWRRQWAHQVTTPFGNVTALSIIPDTSAEIDGVVAEVAEWHDLDTREIGYNRFTISDLVKMQQGDAGSLAGPLHGISAYRSKPANVAAASKQFPIWLSYVDAVLQGYLHQFGEAGMRRFVETTIGWNGAILDDRVAPKYPRKVQTTNSEQKLFDLILRDIIGG